MPKHEVSVVINRPIEEVFAFVENPENDPIWRNSMVEAKVETEADAKEDTADLSQGGEGLGATGREVFRLGGLQVETTWEITEYEQNHKVVYRSTSGPIEYEGSWTYESADGGTKVTFAFQWEIVGRSETGAMPDRLHGRIHRQNIQGSLQALNELLEA